MGRNSAISWTTHTFNPWRGCTKVSAGCVNCYAEQLSKRNPAVLGEWGEDGTRIIAVDSYWRQPLAWDREAASEHRRDRVFVASLADVFEDRADVAGARSRLFALIDRTRHLDWMLLTKRPRNIERLISEATMVVTRENLWLGTSVEDQAAADARRPHLIRCPAAVRFLSLEPLLGPITLRGPGCQACFGEGTLYCGYSYPCPSCFAIGLIIVGCESGPRRRPCKVEWVRSIVSQCRAAGVLVFIKQISVDGRVSRDMSEWPADLRVQECPR